MNFINILKYTIFVVLLGLANANAEKPERPPSESLPADNNEDIKKSFPVQIPRIKGKVILDGINNEAAWEGIKPFKAVQFKPDFMAEPSEKTEMYLAYDKDYLYVAGRLYEKDPANIHSNSKKRDSGDGSSDWFGITIDTFNDKENVVAFFTTPAGLRWDATVTNDGDSFSDMNTSWNTFWDVVTQITNEGWFAEFRIPFSSLRFQDENGRVIMGVSLRRQITHQNDEQVTYPPISPDFDFIGLFKASLLQEVLFEGLQNHSPVYFSPYILAGRGYNHSFNDTDNSYLKQKQVQNELGFDLKYGITSNLTLDVTVNTDFAQVEADYQQANLTRYSLFFPEKRVFFQERASVFNFNFESSDPNRLFHSRRIGIKDGKAVRIYGGARLVGRVGKWDLGILNMQTGESDEAESENFGVFRLRRQALNSFSYVGGIITSRMSKGGYYNRAYGIDGLFRLFGDEYFTIKFAQTYDKNLENKVFSLAPARIRLNWSRRSKKGLGYGLSYSRAGKDYEPGMGFELRDDYSYYGNGLWYGWRPENNSFLYRHRLVLGGKIYQKNSNGIIESAKEGLYWIFETKSNYEGCISPIVYYENIKNLFFLSEKVTIPVGSYTFGGVKLNLTTPTRYDAGADFNMEIGSFYDGWRYTYSLDSRLNLFSSFQLECMYEFNNIKFKERKEALTSHISRISSLYMLNTKFSIITLLQYSSTDDVFTSNVKVRYNPSEGIDLYLVYNENLNTDRLQTRPAMPLSNDRTLLLKFIYTLGI